ncbi:MAG: GNAT family N-acetyltransferase [candidate division WOR-3 bacterium]|nr:MAG: GNAT family N-acetyltransferase [candidate division WOR-3 bacterium]
MEKLTMKAIRSMVKKIPLKDLEAFIDIIANAYPGFGIVSPDDKKKMKQRMVKLSLDPTINHYGVYRDRTLIGGMRTYDFMMNLFSVRTLVGGVGLVAVDLLRKKERACKEMISFFINLYRKKGSVLVALYPFRPDFYRKMGFGYGTKLNLYKVWPGDLPRGGSKKHVRFLNEKDRDALRRCAYRFFLSHHGMLEMKRHELDYFFKSSEAKTVVYKEGKKILGYLLFVIKRVDDANFLRNNIVIRELVYENEVVLSELLTFLHTQLDQIHQILYPTQEEFFHFLPRDPRDGSDNIIPLIGHQVNTQGIGIMYRVIDAKGMFRLLRDHKFGNHNYRLNIVLHDSFTGRGEESLVVEFKDGLPRLVARVAGDVRIHLDIADFSSLMVGSVDYRSLHKYGLSQISDRGFIEIVTDTFRAVEKPICHNTF